MILAALSILVAGALGFLMGGRISNLARLRVRWPWVAVLGLVLQMVPVGGRLAGLVFPALMLSFLLLAAFTIVNVGYPGFAVILIGVVLNFTVIALNHGMPVTSGALAGAHELGSLKALGGGGSRYHLARAGDALLAISDSIGSSVPFRLVVSPGDLLIYGGMVWFVAWGMRRRRPALVLERLGEPGRSAGVRKIGATA